MGMRQDELRAQFDAVDQRPSPVIGCEESWRLCSEHRWNDVASLTECQPMNRGEFRHG